MHMSKLVFSKSCAFVSGQNKVVYNSVFNQGGKNNKDHSTLLSIIINKLSQS